MNRILRLAATAVAAGSLSAAFGQGWAFECIDPENDQPYSTDYSTADLGTALMSIVLGTSGTVTYGGQSGPCYAPARTLDAAGRWSFGVGPEGSIQSAFDNNLALTVGWPIDAAGDYTFAKITVDGETDAESELFGDGGLRVSFVGASNRYAVMIWDGSVMEARVDTRSIGDAASLNWRITNNDVEDHTFGLLFTSYVGMRSQGFDSQSNANQFNSILQTLSGQPKFVDGYVGYTAFPDGRPIRQETKRTQNSVDFPEYVKFMAGQTNAYGLRIDNIPGNDSPGASRADLILIGNHRGPISGVSFDNTIRLNVAGDNTGLAESADILLNETCFVQRFPGQNTAPGEITTITHFIRSAWGVASYNDPYTVVLDAPRLVAYPGGGLNQQTPNPMTFRVWIDNQYAELEKEVPLNNVEIKLDLGEGLAFATGEQQTKFIPVIQANQLRFTNFSLVSDGKTFGDIPVTVTIKTVPGPVKTLTTTIRVAARPEISMVAGPNMLTLPYDFGDSNLDSILGLQAGTEYVAYQWDADLRGYQPVQSIQRGIGYWIIPTNAVVDLELQNANLPADTGTGGLLVNLKEGWNLIGNPYNYIVPVQQLVGVAEATPSNAQSWRQLIESGQISSAITKFVADPSVPGGGSYQIESGLNVLLEPHEAFWVFVNTPEPIRLLWPPVFQETLPNSGRSVDEAWPQTDRQWRLQLSARSSFGHDTHNYVGVVRDNKQADRLSLPKAPLSPGQQIEMAVIDDFKGAPSRLAQALASRTGRNEWKVEVKAEQAGEISLTWPNLPSVPRGVRLRLTDDVTGETKDLRANSGYSFTMQQPGTRSFTLTAEPGGNSRPVIGNVIVTPAGRSGDSPVVINYALSADALVTVRILSGSGKEVFTATRGRSDSAGENKVTWNLRDNADRSVAPGTYQVEILAETPNGERVRKLVPVNVTR